MQKAHQRIADTRSHWPHQVSRAIADRARVVEHLHTQGKTKSAREHWRSQGKTVPAKSGVLREIVITGGYRLEPQLGYRAEVVKTHPVYTSQPCSVCGHRRQENRESQSVFQYVADGHAEDADLNAARNILASGIGATARGEAFPLGTPLSHEKI